MKIYYDETNGNYMTERQFQMWASAYIDGLIHAGRHIDELPTIEEVMLNADHISLLCEIDDSMCGKMKIHKDGYQTGYNTTIDASLTVDSRFAFLIEQMLEVNGFDWCDITDGEVPCEDGVYETKQFTIHSYMHYATKLKNLFDRADEIIGVLIKIREKMISDVHENIYGIIAPYQDMLGIKKETGIDSEYDINDSVNDLNDTLIELLVYQMRENGLLIVKED